MRGQDQDLRMRLNIVGGGPTSRAACMQCRGLALRFGTSELFSIGSRSVAESTTRATAGERSVPTAQSTFGALCCRVRSRLVGGECHR